MTLLAPGETMRSLMIALALLGAPRWARAAEAAASINAAEADHQVPEGQALSCWEDGPGFFGTTVRYLRLDGLHVEERIGFDAGDRVLHTFHRGMSVCLKAHGEVTIGTGGRILSLPEGTWLLIAGRDSTRNVELRLANAPAGASYAWSVDNVPTSFGPEAESLLALAGEYWPYFDRIAAVNAEVRRIGQELEALANARENQRVRVLAAVAREQAIAGALADVAEESLGELAVITQDTMRITITTRTGADEETRVYNLNGSESRNVLTLGNESVEQVSRARWQGNRLVITSSVEVGNTALETTMFLALDSFGRLVVESTAPRGTGAPDAGVSGTTTRRYRRNNG